MILLYVKSKHAYYNISCLPKYRQFLRIPPQPEARVVLCLKCGALKTTMQDQKAQLRKNVTSPAPFLSFQRSENKIKRKHSTRCFTKMEEQINGTILLLEGATQLAVAAPGLIA